jgi:hypothetical protein
MSKVDIIRKRDREIRNWPLVHIVFGVIAGFFNRFWGIVRIIIGVPSAVLVNMLIGSILGKKCWNQCEKDYENLIAEGCTNEEALLIISEFFHPELTEDIHEKIFQKFNSIDLKLISLQGRCQNIKKLMRTQENT